MMTVHPDQAETNYKHSHMTFRACVKLPLYVDGVDTRINTQMLKPPHDLLFHLEALENVINPDIGTLKNEKVKTALRYTYLGGTTTTALKNEFDTFRKIYYDKYNQVIINQSVNEFYTRFLFKIYALPQEVELPLDIAVTLFNNLRPDVREFLISEGVKVPQILST